MLVLNRYLLEQYVHSKSVKLWLAIIRFNSKSLIMKIGPCSSGLESMCGCDV